MNRIEEGATWPWTWWLRGAHVRRWGSIELCIYPHHTKNVEEELFSRIEDGLALILDAQPWRARRLSYDIQRVLSVYPTGAQYVPSIRSCVIGYLDLLHLTREEIAATIVHEATHGRISNAGIEYHPDCRERIERVCLRAEKNFLRALSGQPRLERRELGSLTPWWTEKHHVDGLTSQLRELGVPEFWIRAAVLLRRLKRGLRIWKKRTD